MSYMISRKTTKDYEKISDIYHVKIRIKRRYLLNIK